EDRGRDRASRAPASRLRLRLLRSALYRRTTDGPRRSHRPRRRTQHLRRSRQGLEQRLVGGGRGSPPRARRDRLVWARWAERPGRKEAPPRRAAVAEGAAGGGGAAGVLARWAAQRRGARPPARGDPGAFWMRGAAVSLTLLILLAALAAMALS